MILSAYAGKEIDDAVLGDLVTLLGGGTGESKRLHTPEYYAWKLLNDFGSSLVILAYDKATLRPIGCITFTAKPSSLESNPRLFELGDVMVTFEARGSMLFIKMLRIGLDRLKTGGNFCVYGTPNDEAWPHEKRVGFSLVNNGLKYYGVPFALISAELLCRVATAVLRLSSKIIPWKGARENISKPGRLRLSAIKKMSIAGSIIDIVAQALFYPLWLSILLPFYFCAKLNSKIRVAGLEKFDALGCTGCPNSSFLLKNTAYLNWRYVEAPDVYIRRALYNKNGLVAIYVFKDVKFNKRRILYLVDTIYCQTTIDSRIGLLYVIVTLPIYRYFSLVAMRSAGSMRHCALARLFIPLRSIKFIVFPSSEADVRVYSEFCAGDGDNI
jgi:hypothetical protein